MGEENVGFPELRDFQGVARSCKMAGERQLWEMTTKANATRFCFPEIPQNPGAGESGCGFKSVNWRGASFVVGEGGIGTGGVHQREAYQNGKRLSTDGRSANIESHKCHLSRLFRLQKIPKIVSSIGRRNQPLSREAGRTGGFRDLRLSPAVDAAPTGPLGITVPAFQTACELQDGFTETTRRPRSASSMRKLTGRNFSITEILVGT